MTTEEVVTHEGIFIQKIPTDKEGEYTIQIQELGGLDPLSVPTLLRYAAKLKEQSLGI